VGVRQEVQGFPVLLKSVRVVLGQLPHVVEVFTLLASERLLQFVLALAVRYVVIREVAYIGDIVDKGHSPSQRLGGADNEIGG
jgi:hypothetical protein